MKDLRQLVRPLAENQGLSQLLGHGPFLVCEAVLHIIQSLASLDILDLVSKLTTTYQFIDDMCWCEVGTPMVLYV